MIESEFPRAGWIAACPYCEQPEGQPCRTLKTKRVTDTHAIRYDASWEQQKHRRMAEIGAPA